MHLQAAMNRWRACIYTLRLIFAFSQEESEAAHSSSPIPFLVTSSGSANLTYLSVSLFSFLINTLSPPHLSVAFHLIHYFWHNKPLYHHHQHMDQFRISAMVISIPLPSDKEIKNFEDLILQRTYRFTNRALIIKENMPRKLSPFPLQSCISSVIL